jgi:hypothetical protein
VVFVEYCGHLSACNEQIGVGYEAERSWRDPRKVIPDALRASVEGAHSALGVGEAVRECVIGLDDEIVVAA